MISFYLFALIYQEAGYRYPSFIKYFMRHFYLIIGPILAYLPFFIYRRLPFVAIYVGAYLFILLFFATLKLRLKTTKRIKRLFIVYMLIMIGVSIYNYFLIPYCFLIAFLLATLILLPVEKAIANYYLNKAIIKARTFKGKRIAITGSYGKTSTKFFIKELLAQSHYVLATPNSYNTPIGISAFINRSDLSLAEILVYEFGARKKGDIKELCEYFKYDIAIVTGIEVTHIDTFKSLKTILNEKMELAANLPAEGLLLINYENQYLREYPLNRDVISYGFTYGDYRAKDLKLSLEGSSFSLYYRDQFLKGFETSLIGRAAIINVLPALILALKWQIPLPTYLPLKNVDNRLSVRKGDDFTIISDAYNANPIGFSYAIELLNTGKGVKYIITPGYAEMKSAFSSLVSHFTALLNTLDYVILVKNNFTMMATKGLKVPYKMVSSFKEGYQFFLKNKKEKALLLIENDFKDL